MRYGVNQCGYCDAQKDYVNPRKFELHKQLGVDFNREQVFENFLKLEHSQIKIHGKIVGGYDPCHKIHSSRHWLYRNW